MLEPTASNVLKTAKSASVTVIQLHPTSLGGQMMPTASNNTTAHLAEFQYSLPHLQDARGKSKLSMSNCCDHPRPRPTSTFSNGSCSGTQFHPSSTNIYWSLLSFLVIVFGVARAGSSNIQSLQIEWASAILHLNGTSIRAIYRTWGDTGVLGRIVSTEFLSQRNTIEKSRKIVDSVIVLVLYYECTYPNLNPFFLQGHDLSHITAQQSHHVWRAPRKTQVTSRRWSHITDIIFWKHSLRAPMNPANRIIIFISIRIKKSLRAQSICIFWKKCVHHS